MPRSLSLSNGGDDITEEVCYSTARSTSSGTFFFVLLTIQEGGRPGREVWVGICGWEHEQVLIFCFFSIKRKEGPARLEGESQMLAEKYC